MELASCVVGAMSLALQLPNAIKDVYTLLDSIRDAPSDLAALKRKLKISEWMICGISRIEYSCGTNEEALKVGTLIQEEYWQVLNDLRSLVTKLTCDMDARSTVRRRWAKVEWACRAEKIGKLKIRLHDTKLNLLLVQRLPDFHSSSFQAAKGMLENHSMNATITVHVQTDPSEGRLRLAPVHGAVILSKQVSSEAQALDYAFNGGVEQTDTGFNIAGILEDTASHASSGLLSMEQSLFRIDLAGQLSRSDQHEHGEPRVLSTHAS